jgi:hypothetical protein
VLAPVVIPVPVLLVEEVVPTGELNETFAI